MMSSLRLYFLKCLSRGTNQLVLVGDGQLAAVRGATMRDLTRMDSDSDGVVARNNAQELVNFLSKDRVLRIFFFF